MRADVRFRIHGAENNLMGRLRPSRNKHLPHQAADLLLGESVRIPACESGGAEFVTFDFDGFWLAVIVKCLRQQIDKCAHYPFLLANASALVLVAYIFLRGNEASTGLPK